MPHDEDDVPKNDDAALFEIGRRGLHTLSEELRDSGREGRGGAYFDNITHIVASIAYALKKGAEACQLVSVLRNTIRSKTEEYEDKITILDAKNVSLTYDIEKKGAQIQELQGEVVSLQEQLGKGTKTKKQKPDEKGKQSCSAFSNI